MTKKNNDLYDIKNSLTTVTRIPSKNAFAVFDHIILKNGDEYNGFYGYFKSQDDFNTWVERINQQWDKLGDKKT